MHTREKARENRDKRLYSSSLLQNPDDTQQYSQAARLAISVREACEFQLYGGRKNTVKHIQKVIFRQNEKFTRLHKPVLMALSSL